MSLFTAAFCRYIILLLMLRIRRDNRNIISIPSTSRHRAWNRRVDRSRYEELRKVQASIHERFYKSFLIGDLRMGLDAVREHYDTIEQALGEQSLYDLGTHIA